MESNPADGPGPEEAKEASDGPGGLAPVQGDTHIESEDQPPAKRPAIRVWHVASVLVGVLAIGGAIAWASSRDSEEQPAIRGQITLVGADFVEGDWDSCEGLLGTVVGDFVEGMAILVKDESGTIIGSDSARSLRVLPPALQEAMRDRAMLSEGDPYEELLRTARQAKMTDDQCTLWFDVPVSEASFYQIEVGADFGGRSFSTQQLEDTNYWVDLELAPTQLTQSFEFEFEG